MCVINLKMPSDLCKRFAGLCVFLWVFSVTADAQTGGVTATATVSKTVALSIGPNSIAPNSIHGDVNVDVVSSGSTVRMTLSGTGAQSAVIRVPLLLRSNTSFKILGRFESNTALLNQLSVIDVRATGSLVSPGAVNLELPDRSNAQELKTPFVVLTGPRVSLGGTLNSPNNALQITLLIRLKHESVGSWLAHLTLFND
jgi:hypothetical protein